MMGYKPYNEHDNYEPTYYEQSDQNYQEFKEQAFYGEQAFYWAEVGMAAHIQGLQGRAAQMGHQFHDQVWGQGCNFGLPNNNTTAKLNHALPHPSATAATTANATHINDDPTITRIQSPSRLRRNPFATVLSCAQLLIS